MYYGLNSSGWSEDRFLIGAVSAKIRAHVEARFRRFNAGQKQRPTASGAGRPVFADELVSWAVHGHRAFDSSVSIRTQLQYRGLVATLTVAVRR